MLTTTEEAIGKLNFIERKQKHFKFRTEKRSHKLSH